MKRWIMAVPRALGTLLDARSAAALAALTSIWYGVESGRPSFWVVGALVYVTIFAFELPDLLRSRRSE